MGKFNKIAVVLIGLIPLVLSGTYLLIPMDNTQTDHLRAYGVVYRALQRGITVEWLLNYRGGSFLMRVDDGVVKDCILKGVYYEKIGEAQKAAIYMEIEEKNMERVELTVAPKIAVYIPPNYEPWDDAVTLALTYAGIPYDQIWDEEVLSGALDNYDWLHLHHEDFTGQYGKFYASFHNAPWYQQEVRTNKAMARRLGFKKVWQLKHAVAAKIKEYVLKGGFLLAMCSATETLDIALAALGIDIVPLVDGDGVDMEGVKHLNYKNTFAFKDFQVELNPLVYSHSNIDVSREAYRRGPNVYFVLREFNAKYDPIPTLLTQDHTRYVKEFLGQTTGFRRNLIKDEVVVLADIPGTEEVKYIYRDMGKGFVTFLGGHDPEDFTHRVGDPPTDLRLHKNSPGYRLILNNVLFPAAKVKRLLT